MAVKKERRWSMLVSIIDDGSGEKGFLKKNDIVGILKYEAPFPSDVKIEVFDAAFTDHEVKTKRANRR
jgi:hypothetical protein